jgi:hypothetical protein
MPKNPKTKQNKITNNPKIRFFNRKTRIGERDGC